MKEYITKDRAKQFVCGHCNEVCSEEPCEPSDCDWMAFIDKEPAADVVEVKHGRWVHNENYEDWAEKYVCSECNRNAPSDGDYRHNLTDYCPHCGAKMDKEE